MRSAAVQVTQQHCLETGALPHNEYVVLSCHALRTVGALRVSLSLVVIEQHETLWRRNARLFQVRKLANRHFYPRQRIAGTLSQISRYEVDMQASLIDQALKKASIAKFRRAFTADINQPALRDVWRAAASHPRCGTPPYAPLKYLR